MSDKKYPSNLYLESAATNIDFAKQVSVEAVVVMAKELLALRKSHEGWQLVPVEPTTEMLEEIWLDERFKEVAMKRRYQALLAAAPSPHE